MFEHRPARLSDAHTRTFCESLVPNGKPSVFVPVPPPGAALNDCVNLVNAAVQAHGGVPLDGWAIWEMPGVLIEAEYHRVWQKPDGTVQDLTPLPSGISSRLFLHDPQLQYQDRQINNVRQNLSGHPSVDRWIAALNAKFALLNKGERALQHGEVSIPREESGPVFDALMRAELEVGMALLPRGQLTAETPGGAKVGRNETCPCGSGVKYKKCHGKREN